MTSGRTQGRFRRKGDTIELDFDRRDGARYERNRAGRLLIVSWGRRTYLVSPLTVVDFCNAINGGDEPRCDRWGDYYLRWSDWTASADQRPRLPAFAAPYLLASPIQGRILRLAEQGNEVASLADQGMALLDVGYLDGLKMGMPKCKPNFSQALREGER